MDFADPETAPTILPFTKFEITGESEMLWRACSPMSPEQSLRTLVAKRISGGGERILRGQIKCGLLLSEGEKATLAEIGHRLGQLALFMPVSITCSLKSLGYDFFPVLRVLASR
jgi:hypothetical protein